MCKCQAPVPVAISYYKERNLTQVTEIMCFRCETIESVAEIRRINEIIKEALNEDDANIGKGEL